MGSAIIHVGAVQTGINLPTWAPIYPTLKIDPVRMFAGALVVDNLTEGVSTAIASHTADRSKNVAGTTVLWVQHTGTINVLNGVATPSVIDNANKCATVDLGTADVTLETTARQRQ